MQALGASSRISARTLAPSRPSRACVKPMALFGTASPSSDIYSIKVKDIDGKDVKMDKFKGEVLLIVNLASACGFTPQYTELQGLYEKYKNRKFQVLGFPCNQFGSQEPGSNADIKKFARDNYKATFPLMSKVDVNGAGADPLFQYLKEKKGGILNNDIKWNFSKFLVDRQGNVVGRYPSTTKPEEIAGDIEKYL
uniref:Glutathione peroxidase n=1 Tax=Dunaliella tertiolecta TaxID=3047 RepID=A0A7S3QUE6_DUNTE|nr:glutathione peroxidase 1 [Dunaliella salina]|mmetsp:Transcript_22103/g.61175  ORF Transcript_22103/g.61175 Transcript_22103/m.61175 type:complete len:195 (-) Transcript_22103:566-1150(-)